MPRTLIINARVAGQESPTTWILIENERIKAISSTTPPPVSELTHAAQSQTQTDANDSAPKIIDAAGALVMPGAIDCHVHFREPGMEHKADIASESQAALAGGVTSFIDMPNNRPPTVTIADWEAKMGLAAEKSCINYAFFIGATNNNIDQLRQADYTRIPGVKLFMGSSTGNMLVDNDSQIERIFASVPAIVAVHTEDQAIISANTARARAAYGQGCVPIEQHSSIRSAEACYASTSKAVALAHKHGHRLHICHLTTAAELSLLQTGPVTKKLVTSEVSPHHLIFTDDDYARLGARIKMNPAVKTSADRDALRRALADGLIDMVATDHAPHLLSEKQGDALTAVSGAPAVQFSLPLLLDIFDEAIVQRAYCEAPADVYGIVDRGRLQPGAYADIVMINRCTERTITDDDVISKCGWTPYAGAPLRHQVKAVWVNGTLAYSDGQTLPHRSAALRFNS